MSNYTRHQQNIIRKYYQNRENIALQRAQELITELYLTQGKKREQHWKSLATHLEALGVKPAEIEQLVKKDKPELAAKLIENLVSKS